jgi:multiple sugar transport system permease protein
VATQIQVEASIEGKRIQVLDLFTVPLMLNQFRGQYTVDRTLLMAGSAIAVIPVLVVYLIGQRKIIEGITLRGLTGR